MAVERPSSRAKTRIASPGPDGEGALRRYLASPPQAGGYLESRDPAGRAPCPRRGPSPRSGDADASGGPKRCGAEAAKKPRRRAGAPTCAPAQESGPRRVLAPAKTRQPSAQRTSSALGRAYRRLAGIVEEADDAILAAGPDLRITLFNRGAERMFGYCAAEILGQPLELLIPDRFRAEHAGHVERFAKCEVRARRMRERSQIIARRKNGEEFPAEASILKLQVNGAMEFAAIVRDASARKREENALRRLKEQAEVASRAKSRFLANMGHELRTPLNAIIGFSQVMLKGIHGPLGHPRYEDYVASILESGELLLEILNDILDMSKIEAGKIVAHPTELAIEDAVNSVLRVLAGRAAAANIRLCGELAQGLPRIRADERMVRQILLNLVSNAIKFTPEGGDVLVSAGREPGGEVVLVVADTGIGMAAADIPKALEPFGQIDSALARRHPGTGLGLPLVKSMVELHGGTLAIDSREGAGTTVTVCFPAAIALDPPAPAAGSEETRHPHAGGTDAARAARVAAGC